MDFKNTKDFFEAVSRNKLLKIDITNYLEKLTNNEIEKLQILQMDLRFYIMDKKRASDFSYTKLPIQVASFAYSVHLAMEKEMQLFIQKIFKSTSPLTSDQFNNLKLLEELKPEERVEGEEGEGEEGEGEEGNIEIEDPTIIEWDEHVLSYDNFCSKTFYLITLHRTISAKIDYLTRKDNVVVNSYNEIGIPLGEGKGDAEIQLKDFFDKDYSNQKIFKIKNAAKTLKGKKLAILIFLLDKKHDLINYSLSSRTNSRKNFLLCLRPELDFSVQGVNKYFLSGTGDLNFNYENDNDYLQLDAIILNCME